MDKLSLDSNQVWTSLLWNWYVSKMEIPFHEQNFLHTWEVDKASFRPKLEKFMNERIWTMTIG
jgi:hypothetical protein